MDYWLTGERDRARPRTLYIELDGPIADLAPALDRIPRRIVQKYRHPGEIPGIYALTELTAGAADALQSLREQFRVLLVTSAAWDQPRAATDRLRWLYARIGHLSEGKRPIRVVSTPDHGLLGDGVFVRGRDALPGVVPGERSLGFRGSVWRYGSADFPDWSAVNARMSEVDGSLDS